MTPHDTLRLFTKTLEDLEKWMDKADEHAKARSFEVDVLAQTRLAPDQFALVQQVQSACDQAKYAAAYHLAGGIGRGIHPVLLLEAKEVHAGVGQAPGQRHAGRASII